MAAYKKTSLSAGEIIRALILQGLSESGKSMKVYPIISDKADLPYITYRRESLEPHPQKGVPANDSVAIVVECFTSRYTEGVELAEIVRSSLDGRSGGLGWLNMRSCVLSDASEDWHDDAFVQTLVFTVRI